MEYITRSACDKTGQPPWRVLDPRHDALPVAGAISEALFAGTLIVCRKLEPVQALVARARAIVEQHVGDHPSEAERRLYAQAFQKTAQQIRNQVQNDETIEDCWQQTLAALGYIPSEVYRDRVRLRVVPSRPEARTRTIRPLEPHRDTWGSGVMAQVNWWLPLYPLHPQRTMLLWPDRFREAVSNTSDQWDYEELMQGRTGDYPLLPVARSIPPEPGEPVLIEPGELLLFSAAHLHAGISDASGRTRFSLDTRTVWKRDVETGRGAPDVDRAPRRVYWEMFERDASAQS